MTTTSNESAFRSASIYHADRLTDLVRIFDSDVQLCIYRRSRIEEIAHYFDSAYRSGQLGLGARLIATPGQAVDFPGLAPILGREAVLEDMAYLIDLYGELIGCPQVGVRLEMLDRAMCPRFHVDRVGLRLLCSYYGPGTEWLSEEAADRSKLGARANGLPDHESGLILDDTAISQAPPFALLLLKGTQWQDNGGRGAIHRSPALADDQQRRVLLALDAIW